MASITAPGIGSGIDISGLVDQLVAARGDPAAQLLDEREAEYQAQISGFGMLKSALSTFQGLLDGLNDAAVFNGRTTSSANGSVFTASASESAAPGTFGIEVVRLAESHKLLSKGFTDADVVVGVGTLTIAVDGDSFDITLDAANNTLGGIRDAINDAADNVGVSATIINVDDGMGGTESKMVLTSNATGESSAITLIVDDTTDGDDLDPNVGLSQLVYDPDGAGVTNMTEIDQAIDAQIKIDGQTVTRSTNTITDALDGVTVNLVSADPGSEYDLTVALDDSAASSAIANFVTGFNTLVDTFDEINSYDSETGQAKILFGDSTARTIESRIRRELSNVVASVGGAYNSLPSIGVTTDEVGKLEIDQDTLDAAIEADRDTVAGLFSATDGYANTLDTLLEGYITTDGTIDVRTDGINEQLDDIADSREALALQLESLESRLLAQFNAMDALVAQLQTTGDFLTQQLVPLQTLISGRN